MKYFFLFLILTGFFALSLGSALRESLTFDEIVHLEEGANHLKSHSFAIDTNNPPFIRELTAIPKMLGLGEPIYARLVTILLGEVLLISVFFIVRTYFGTTPAILSVFLLAFDPTFFAHSHYVTLDVGFALFFLLAWWALYARRYLLFGMLFGLAAASRVTAWVFLIGSGLWFVQRIHLKKLLLVGLLSSAVIWATYFFRSDVIIAKRTDPSRLSSRLASNPVLSPLVFFMKTQPVPLGNYLAVIKNNALRAGQSRRNWAALGANFFLKTPIPMLLLLLVFFFRLFTQTELREKTRMVYIPLLTIFAVTSISGQQPWVRYLLPMYPFMAIAEAMGIWGIWDKKDIRGKFLCIVLFLWYVGGTLIQFPHFISYANELAGPKDKRFEKLVDSNLDWGQALPDLARYVRQKNPIQISFSYFGRDNGNDYGLVSATPWGSYKSEEICAFHEIPLVGTGDRIVAISATNWYQCGYMKQPQFQKEKIKDVVADSILIF